MTSSNIRSVTLRWTGEGLVFAGGPNGSPEVTIDSDGVLGPGPMHLLLLALGGCMAVDVQMILEKSRVPVDSLEVDVVGERALTDPKRYLKIALVYRLAGPSEEHEARLQRAIDLSRDKYCSVLHTLDPEIEFDIRVERVGVGVEDR